MGAPFSYIASSLKLILPALYGYWLILNLLDRKVPAQPFMKLKLLWLTPLGFLILTETILDASFFFSVPPRQVSCCTSLFDVPRDDILKIATESTWIWVVLFYITAALVAVQILYFLFAQKKSTLPGNRWWFGSKAIMVTETLIITFCFIVFVLALQTKISPLFLGLPFHHCIFCLCQEVWDALLSFFMIFTGLSLLLIYFWVISSSNYPRVNNVLNDSVVTLLKWSGFMFYGGFIIFSIHLFIAVFYP